MASAHSPQSLKLPPQINSPHPPPHPPTNTHASHPQSLNLSACNSLHTPHPLTNNQRHRNIDTDPPPPPPPPLFSSLPSSPVSSLIVACDRIRRSYVTITMIAGPEPPPACGCVRPARSQMAGPGPGMARTTREQSGLPGITVLVSGLGDSTWRYSMGERRL